MSTIPLIISPLLRDDHTHPTGSRTQNEGSEAKQSHHTYPMSFSSSQPEGGIVRKRIKGKIASIMANTAAKPLPEWRRTYSA